MKPISLLPSEIMYYRIKKRRRLLCGLSLSALLILFIIIYVLLSIAIMNINLQTDNVKDTKVNVEARIEELSPYKVLYDGIIRVEEILGTALGDKPNWQRLLISLGE